MGLETGMKSWSRSPLSKEYIKVFVRGRCVEISREVIKKFLGSSEEACTEFKVADDQICKDITSQQVKEWPVKGKLPSSKLSVKYVLLHKIGAAN